MSWQRLVTMPESVYIATRDTYVLIRLYGEMSPDEKTRIEDLYGAYADAKGLDEMRRVLELMASYALIGEYEPSDVREIHVTDLYNLCETMASSSLEDPFA